MVAVFVVACAGGGAPAFAASAKPASGVHLSWIRTDSASQCPDASHLEADVAQRLGRPVVPGSAPASIEVAVSKSDGTWKAQIEMRGQDGGSMGSRTVTSEAPSCASLASAASLAIALMIDRYASPSTRARARSAPSTQPSSPPPAAVPAAETAAGPVLARASRSANASPLPFHGALAVVGAVASNVLPRTSLGIGIAADVNLGERFYASLGGNFFPEQRIQVSDIDVAFSMTWGALGGCYRVVSRGPVRLSGCAAWLVGAMHSVVFTPVPWQTGQQLWAGATAGPRLAWSPAEPLEIRANLEALVPVRRRTYAIERVPPESNTFVFTEPALSVIASVGIGLRY